MQFRNFTITKPKVVDRRVRFLASTAAVDSQGTRIRPFGCNLNRFHAAGSLPLLWNHRRNGEPADVLGRVIEVEITAKGVFCTAEFETHERAVQVLAMIRSGTLRGCSIAFCDEVASAPDKDGIVDITAWTLVELSVTPCGSNPEAVAIRSRNFTLSALPQVATVLVCRESDSAQLWGRRHDSGRFSTPSGRILAGEKPQDVALRVLLDQTGIAGDVVRLQSLGAVDTGQARVHCFALMVPAGVSAHPSQEVMIWEWLPLMPTDTHENPCALERFVGARTLLSSKSVSVSDRKVQTKMNPAEILKALNLEEGATPEAIAAALLAYSKGADSDEQKTEMIKSVLGMVVATPSAASDSGEALAREAMADEVRSLQSRVAELEGEKTKAEEKAQPTPAERAAQAVRDGQWMQSQTAVDALTRAYAEGKTVALMPKNYFTRRNQSAKETAAVSAPAKTAPVLGQAVELNAADRAALKTLRQRGITITDEDFAARKGAQ